MNRYVSLAILAAWAALAVVLAAFSSVSAEAPDKMGPLAFAHSALAAAQASQRASDPAITPTATVSAPDISTPIGLISPTVQVEASAALTPAGAEASAPAQPLSGTILSNLTEYAARFFLEGQVSLLDPLRSTGFEIPRVTAVLNLFSCEASAPETQSGCYWDPYLLQRDGFYEIYDTSQLEGLPHLMLREANLPPANQVWMQNRTASPETVVFKDTQYDVAAGAVEQFEVASGTPAIVYVRSCLTLDDETVCEWSPLSLSTGGYFAMVEVSTPGGVPGSLITTIDLRPVLDSGDGNPSGAPAAPTEIVCQLQVPAINVRSGPGLQYEIIGKVRESAGEPGRVVVAGRSADRQWLSVADSVATGGWVTSSSSFILCTGDAEDLPIKEFAGGALAATPTPVAVVQAPPADDGGSPTATPPAPQDSGAAEGEEVEPTVAPADESASEIPEGLARLVVNNGFQFDMRFTIDQQYRPEEGPSEYDLLPGESVSILVYPGQIAFTASSPWNGLSGNSDLNMGSDESITLWLRFEPDQGSSGEWNLAWQ